MSDLNRTILSGRLTRDPELRKTQSGKSVTSFSLAVDRQFKKDRQEDEQSADFISCVVWNKTAEYLSQYGRKGARIGVEGRLQSRTYEKDGRTVYITEVVCDSVVIYDFNNRSAAEQQTATTDPHVYGGPSTYQEAKSQTDAVKDSFSDGLDIDDDLPF